MIMRGPAKPPKPSITYPEHGSTHLADVRISGTCLAGATVAVQDSVGNSLRGQMTVSGTTWSFLYPWEPGTKDIKAVQTLNEQTSEATPVLQFFVIPPKPDITAPKEGSRHSAGRVGIEGTCFPGASVQILNRDGSFLANAEVDQTTWKYAIEWDAGPKHIKVEQTVNGQISDPTGVREFFVKPATPAIKQPPIPALPNLALTLTGIASGSPTLEMFTGAGNKVAGTFSTTGATCTFTPTAGWSENTSVQLVQTVSTVASDPSNFVSIVTTTLNRPLITVPLRGSRHLADVMAGGLCAMGATVIVQDSSGNALKGKTFVTGSVWSFQYPWVPGSQRIKAVQILNGQPSAPSEPHEFFITLPKPQIAIPSNPDNVKQVLHVSNISPGNVTLQMFTDNNERVDGTFSSSGYSRSFTPSQNWQGITRVMVVQTLNNVDSDPSDAVTVEVLKPSRPTITVPEPGGRYPVGSILFEGRCLVGAAVEITNSDGSFLANADVKEQTWKCSLTWGIGLKHIKAVQTLNGRNSDATEVIEFFVTPPTPGITPPPNPATEKQVLTLTSIASGSVNLAMFTEANREVVGSFSNTGGNWIFTPTFDWALGINNVYIVQTVNSVDSDPSPVCTFNVGTPEPEAPQFEHPPADSITSLRPLLRLKGLPVALFTVRHEGGEILFSGNADAKGILEHILVTPLTPGAIALEVKQEIEGSTSVWSAPHLFTAKELPAPPSIITPTEGSVTPRKPMIRGEGKTGGTISLRHVNDSENLIDSFDGYLNWRWQATTDWDVGLYSIQVQQTHGGVDSEWSLPRNFRVTDAQFVIGDTEPGPGQPLVSSREGVILRVHVVSGRTGLWVGGVKVEWRYPGDEAIRATTVTGQGGWAEYHFVPESTGDHTILADLTQANQGIEIFQRFKVTSL